MSAILPVYRRCNISIAKGEGVYLYSPDGDCYLDFAAGIAVNALGHCHPHVTKALKDQADILWHCSNMYQMAGLTRMAQRLTEVSFADKVFFCNTGSEAVECGLKMIRKYHDANGQPERFRVITMKNGFHGRTLACISAGGNDIARKGYEPLMDGFDAAELNNLADVKSKIGAQTAAILVEPIQGEGGIHVASHEFLQGLRQLCDEHGLLLFADEVQCGMGRTGSLFAYEHAGITPDIVSSAKGIGNGFPMGACLTTDKVAACMQPGTHGSTYGANPLAMAVGNAVLDVILAPEFFEQVKHVSSLLKEGLFELAGKYPHIFSQVRGEGLLLGMQMEVPAFDMVEKLRAKNLLTTAAAGNVLRITPPLIITEEHVSDALQIIEEICREWS